MNRPIFCTDYLQLFIVSTLIAITTFFGLCILGAHTGCGVISDAGPRYV